MKKSFGLLFGLLILATAICSNPVALAQSAVSATVDTWTGRNESVQSQSISVDNTGTAVIFTGVSGKILNIKAISTITASSAGIVSLLDGSNGTVLWKGYLSQTTPFQIPESELGIGLTSSSGNGIYASSTVTATITISARVQKK
jgi:hypothetical protein